MTNRKIRPGNINKNLFLLSLAKANMETLARLMLAAIYSEGLSRPKVRELMQVHEREYIPVFEKLSADDMQNITVKRRLAQLRVDFAELAVFRYPGFSEDMQTTLRENAGIYLIMLGDECHFGGKRLRRMIAWAAEHKGEAVRQIEKELGIHFGTDDMPDVDSYKHREPKLSRSELERIRRDGTAVAIMQGVRGNE